MEYEIKPWFVDYPDLLTNHQVNPEDFLKITNELKEISKKYNIQTIPSLNFNKEK